MNDVFASFPPSFFSFFLFYSVSVCTLCYVEHRTQPVSLALDLALTAGLCPNVL